MDIVQQLTKNRVENLEFELRAEMWEKIKKLDHHFQAKFHGESIMVISIVWIDALKRCLDPEIAHGGLSNSGAKQKNRSLEKVKTSC